MKLEYQLEVLRFLSQDKTGKRYIPLLDSTLFDLNEHQIVYDLLLGYVKHYKSLPNKVNMIEWFDREARQSNQVMKPEVYRKIEDTIRDVYIPVSADENQIRETLIEEYQKKLTKEMFRDYSGKIKEADAKVFKEMYRKMQKISTLSDQTEDERDRHRGEYLLRDYQQGVHRTVEGAPTYLKGLNAMTAAGGFFSPQLIIIMGGPKSFKTGTLINLAVKYVRDGKKVYYADAENGKFSIRDRAKQTMLECTFQELRSGELDDTLTEMVKRYKAMGGDMKTDFYPAHTKSMADVEAELEELKEKDGWIPDVICFDYLDLFKPIDPKITDKRLGIQAVYFDAIRLLEKWAMFGITLSQVRKEAVDKKYITIKDFAEDFAKAANCHAAFALCGDEDEKAAGFRRLVPVAQREGVGPESGAVCLLRLDMARMLVQETSFEEAAKVLGDTQETKAAKTAKRKGKAKDKNLKDE